LESRPSEVAHVWEKVGVNEHRVLEPNLPAALTYAATLSSLSAPRATILIASSGSGAAALWPRFRL
jgi:hypothetical protein